MAKTRLVNPHKLVTLQQAAAEFGVTAEHLRQLAVGGRIEAWLVGAYWITTNESVLAYMKIRRPPGRPKGTRKNADNAGG